MKEPKKHVAIAPPDYGEDICAKCIVDWPCRKWVKWTDSPEYRADRLADSINALTNRVRAAEKRADQFEYRIRMAAEISQALIRFATTSGCKITVHQTQDYIEAGSILSGPFVIPGRRDFKVVYEHNGETWIDGIMTDKVY